MAALQLQRLGHVLGEVRYLDAARRTLELFAAEINHAAHAFGTLVSALAEYAEPPALVILTGTTAQAAAWHAELGRRYLPSVLTLRTENTETLPDVLRKPGGEAPQVWICHGTQCLAPVDTIEGAFAALEPVARVLQ